MKYIMGVKGIFVVDEASELIKRTFEEWGDDRVSQKAAALAYYTIFSIAPLLVIAIAVAGLLWDPAEVQSQVLGQVQGLVGPEGAEFVELLVAGAQDTEDGLVATILGLAGLVLGAIGAFNQLQNSLNQIWEIPEKPPRNFLASVKEMVIDRAVSLTMVLGIGFLLLVSLILSAATAALGEFIGTQAVLSEVLLQGVNFVLSLLVTSLLFAMIFKFLPDVHIAWGDVWLGAFVTALLFSVGKLLIGLYIGNTSLGSSFGAAGSLAILLVWVYYSAQILFLGAEFTQVFANMYGSRIRPEVALEDPSGH